MTEPAVLVGRDGARYPIGEPRWRGEDGSPLMVSALAGIGRDGIDAATRSHWRYRAALPLPLAPLSLGEGVTPLLPLAAGGFHIGVKAEWFNPTGSFKDRGTSVMMALLRSQGLTSILEDSSGNGGASVAAYAAAAGMAARILAPESTSPAKLVQSRVHGAEVQLVAGSRQATAEEALRQSHGRFYASHNWHPFFLQGMKLLAYEIWEDLGFSAPDAVIVPCGAGSLVLGCSIGFGELLRSGAITRLPRILAVQPERCGPLAAAFASGAPAVSPARWEPTIAEGTAIAAPVRDVEVLAAVRASGGNVAAVAEDDIVPAVHLLAGRGLYVEPTSALVVAAVPALAAAGAIAAGDRVVAVLTGSGLKAAEAMARLSTGRA